MRRLLVLCLIASIVDPLPLLAASEAPVLVVETTEIGRQVWVGERFLGSTPVVVDSMTAGTHTLLVGEPPDSASWVLPWEMTVEVPKEGMLRVSVPPLQRLHVFTPPVSVALEIDGRPIGHTPLRLLVPADRLLSIVLRGDDLATQTIEYRATGQPDSLLRVSFALAGGDPDRSLDEVEPRSRRAYLLPVAAVVSGVAGIWARDKADRAYGRYLGTVDRSTMRSELDRASRYDDVAVGCWIAAEVLLAASAWTWLRSSAMHPSQDDETVRLGVALEPLFEGESK